MRNGHLFQNKLQTHIWKKYGQLTGYTALIFPLCRKCFPRNCSFPPSDYEKKSSLALRTFFRLPFFPVIFSKLPKCKWSTISFLTWIRITSDTIDVLTVNCLETHRQLVMSRSSFSQDVTFMSTINTHVRHLQDGSFDWRIQTPKRAPVDLSRDSHLTAGGYRNSLLFTTLPPSLKNESWHYKNNLVKMFQTWNCPNLTKVPLWIWFIF